MCEPGRPSGCPAGESPLTRSATMVSSNRSASDVQRNGSRSGCATRARSTRPDFRGIHLPPLRTWNSCFGPTSGGRSKKSASWTSGESRGGCGGHDHGTKIAIRDSRLWPHRGQSSAGAGVGPSPGSSWRSLMSRKTGRARKQSNIEVPYYLDYHEMLDRHRDIDVIAILTRPATTRVT